MEQVESDEKKCAKNMCLGVQADHLILEGNGQGAFFLFKSTNSISYAENARSYFISRCMLTK